MLFTTYLYILITLCILLFSLFVFFPNNPVYAVLALVSSFVFVSFLLFHHGIDFLALSLIIVYVGAIAVLFLFVVMMLDIKEIMPSALENQALPALVSLSFFLSLVFGLNSFSFLFFIFFLAIFTLATLQRPANFNLVFFNFFNLLTYIIVLTVFFWFLDFLKLVPSITFLFNTFQSKIYEENLVVVHVLSSDIFQGTSHLEPWEKQIDSFYSNVDALGQTLYTIYVIPFLLAGILLLAAIIGAIVLTLQVNTDGLKQDMTRQLSISHLKYNRNI